jgi:hypothetical protein
MPKLFKARGNLRSYLATSVACAILGMMPVAAMAGPCTQQIAELELNVDHTAANPHAGPTAPETTGARLGHQPTIASVKQAQTEAEARFGARLARANALDSAGDRTGCMRALAEAQRSYEIPPANHDGEVP